MTHGTVVACLVLCAAATHPLPAQLRGDSATCFRFDRPYFSWVGRRPGGSAVVRDSTAVIRLAAEAHPERSLVRVDGARSIHPRPFDADSASTHRWLRFSYWVTLRPDSLLISWRNGRYGPVFELSARGDTLLGRVTLTTDVRGLPPRQSDARAVQISCEVER